jgi:hypothetical protein
LEAVAEKEHGENRNKTQKGLRSREEIGLVLSLALSGWLSFRNFGMPSIIIRVTFCGGKQSTLLLLGYTSSTVKGSAPKFSKRTILTGPELYIIHDDISPLRFVIPGLTRNPVFSWIPVFAGITLTGTIDGAVSISWGVLICSHLLRVFDAKEQR